MNDKIDELKPFSSAEEHPLLDPDLDGHSWRYRLWKYSKGWPQYYQFKGNGDRKRIKQKIKSINRKFEQRFS